MKILATLIQPPPTTTMKIEYQQKIDKLISKHGTVDEAKALKREIKDLRRKGLEEGDGEYSVGNLVFKKLRNTEYVAKLFDYWNGLEDKELSLEKVQFKNFINI